MVFDESIRKFSDITFVLRESKINSTEERWERRRIVLDNLNSGPWDAKYYMGWRGKIRNLVERIYETLKF